MDYQSTLEAVVRAVAAGVLGVTSLAVTTRIDSAVFGETDAGSLDDKTSTVTGGLLVGVNGVVVPVAEEFAWRGVIQAALTERFSSTASIGVTSIAFALKHAAVDRSPGRFTTLFTLGTVLGVVRHQFGTGASTIAHMTTNLIASTLALVAQRSE